MILPSLSRLLVPSGTYAFIKTPHLTTHLKITLLSSDHQIHFYTLPSLEPVPIKPVRNAQTFAVDHRHLQRPPVVVNEPVEFCVIKRAGIAMFSMRNDRLFYQKVCNTLPPPLPPKTFGTLEATNHDYGPQEIPLPSGSQPAITARRTGNTLCYSDNEFYNMVDLDQASLYSLLPLLQSPDPTPFQVRPLITVIGENEFLILSWTGTSALGVFITGEGDPVRGTLEWASYPKAICKKTLSTSTHLARILIVIIRSGLSVYHIITPKRDY